METESKSRRTAAEGSRGRRRRTQQTLVLGAEDRIGEGDSFLVLDFLPSNIADKAFEDLRKEVQWNTMFHRGGEVPRLVAVQGQVDCHGCFPIYRHPADESPPLLSFSPTVARIRQRVEEVLHHPVNHVLIQYYRGGADYISEHSDKTIDVVRGSNIVNVSLGAERIMTLRTKKDAAAAIPDSPPCATSVGARIANVSTDSAAQRAILRVSLPHNSMFVMGLETNAKWMHGIRTDKRPLQTKSDTERYANGERISLTFRHIGTFLTPDGAQIFGQGASGKTREEARPVVRGGPEAERLIVAFGNENHQSGFSGEVNYGQGFDVLHFTLRDA
ncbi:hypothetical protein AcV5_001621 [Taiwanofungus camphoratus]|nr:hypothetical protein AcV5_001621 [Antrodia cinnamomea]